MRSETTQHTLSLSPAVRTGRPRVELAALLSALKGTANSSANGKKRVHDTSGDVQGRWKRKKTSPATAADAADDASSSDTAPRTVPVYIHRMEIEYTNPVEIDIDLAEDGTEDQDMHEEPQDDQEQELQEEQTHQSSRDEWDALDAWLNEHTEVADGIELTKVDLQLTEAEKKLVIYHAGKYLFALPSLNEDFDLDAYALRFKYMHDPLVAFHLLSSAGRAEISARIIVSLGSVPETALRISLIAEASFITPEIFNPIELKKRAAQAELEEAQRRTLLHLFLYNRSPPSFHGAVDIPLLYSIVGPAPMPPDPVPLEALQPDALLPTLLPFQRRSVAWLLAREGKTLSADGDVIPIPRSGDSDKPPMLWDEVQVDEDTSWFVDRVRGMLSPERPEDDTDALGGILAEEPGLGKTLECIALIMLNPAPGRNPSTSRWDAGTQLHVKEIKTTLIVTPSSLATQWADELALHAPTLKVLVYDGWSKLPVPINKTAAAKARAARVQNRSKAQSRVSSHSRSSSGSKGKSKRAPSRDAMDVDGEEDDEGDDDTVDWCTYVNAFDVCITTYNVLQQDLNVARAPPRRPRRSGVEYQPGERHRSPLIMVEWLRVIMDEVQMGGGPKAEEMVSLIPRGASFAVSGTPARAQVADLVHVMKFLRVRAVESPRTWVRLLRPGYVEEFLSLFQHYTVRTMKSLVQDELTIPQQTRYLVPIELGKVERALYDQNMEKALAELGLDARGVAVRNGWEINTQLLRTLLRKLRQICTHPQVGQLQNQLDKLYKPGVLKTIGEVLEGMKDQNWRTLVEDRKEKVQVLISIAQLLHYDEENQERANKAVETLLAAEKEARALIVDVGATIKEHNEKGEHLKEDARKLRASRASGTFDEAGSSNNDKSKSRSDNGDDDLNVIDDEDADLPKTRVGDEHKAKKSALQHRLRECRMVLHRVLFYQGDAYHALGEAYLEKENEAYTAADDLRRQLLKGTEEAAQAAMNLLSRKAEAQSLKESDLLIPVPYLGQGGIRSADLMEEANSIIEGLLNAQSLLAAKWRAKLVELLTKSLTVREEAVDGEEYSRSLETQGEAEAYLQAYAALLADRREALLAERTLLDTHEVQEKKKRHTKAAQRAQGALVETEEDLVPLDTLDETEALPEHMVLLKDLNDERKALLEDFDPSRAVKSVMVDLSNISARLLRDNDPEKVISKDAAKRLRELLGEQAKLTETLRVDLAQLRKAFNERISYFRQLQEISDTVMEATWDGSLAAEIDAKRKDIERLDHAIMTGRARRRYLRYLAESQEDGTMDEDQHICVLCRYEFKRGYITQCAHVFCEACLRQWMAQHDGRACPVCRLPIKHDQLQRFSLDGANTAPPPSRLGTAEPAPKSRRMIQYNVIDREVFEGIEETESLGSYGSKIQTLVRHLLYLNNLEPGTKSIVFSAWAESLGIIQHALDRNGITSIRIDQAHGKNNAAKKFRTDPAISVLLLHGERENAGLNVTCASRVFLVESVVHHAFELQAIARIDRMGQTRPTEVYCYYAEETVERNILDLAARRGQSLYTQDNSGGTVDVAPFAMEGSDQKAVDAPTKKGQKGDFVYKTEDMLAIFFPHLFEDIEYLLPEEDAALDETAPAASGTSQMSVVAGPSVLS